MTITYLGNFELISFHELETKQQEEIKDDYHAIDESTFFVDKFNRVHDLNSFMRIGNNERLKSFDGYDSTGFFSSFLVKFDDNYSDNIKLFEAIA